MKVTRTTTSKSETSASLDLFEGRKLPSSVKDQIREEVGTYLVEESLLAVSSAKSPVAGESFPGLIKGPYRKKKLEEVGNATADLQLSGETLDEFSFASTKDGIKIGVFGDRAPVADGHNNLSGKSQLPQRRFIPAEDQSYRPAITKEVDRIVADAIAESASFKKSDFKGVETFMELKAVLEARVGTMTRPETKIFIYRNEDLLDLLDSLDLVRLIK